MEPIGAGWAVGPGSRRGPCNGGGGGGGSSNETTTSTQNVDKRQVVDTGSIGVTSDSSQVTVNASYLDEGAVNKAIDLATTSTATAGANVGEVLGFAKDVLKVAGENLKGTERAFNTATAQVAGAYETVQELSSGQRFLVAGGLLIAGIVAIKTFRK